MKMGHLNDVGMTYCQHMSMSLYFSYRLGVASVKALIHAFFPEKFITSTSDTVGDLRLILFANRSNKS